MAHNIKKGVILGKEVQEVFKYAKEKGFALPAANVISSNSINAALETAVAVNAPMLSNSLMAALSLWLVKVFLTTTNVLQFLEL